MRRKEFYSEYTIRQYDINKLKEVIKVFLEMIESFQSIIDEDSYYIKITSSYEIKVGGIQKPTSSKVEHFVINKYDTIDKQKQLLLKYKNALNRLNEMERTVFINTFIYETSTEELCDKLITYKDKIVLARKSGIVRFCQILGLDKFTNLI